MTAPNPKAVARLAKLSSPSSHPTTPAASCVAGRGISDDGLPPLHHRACPTRMSPALCASPWRCLARCPLPPKRLDGRWKQLLPQVLAAPSEAAALEWASAARALAELVAKGRLLIAGPSHGSVPAAYALPGADKRMERACPGGLRALPNGSLQGNVILAKSECNGEMGVAPVGS